MPTRNPEDIQYARYFTRSTKIPRGTTDVVMERLFPKERSRVPVDDARKNAVYTILYDSGLFSDKEEIDVQVADSEGGFWEGEVSA